MAGTRGSRVAPRANRSAGTACAALLIALALATSAQAERVMGSPVAGASIVKGQAADPALWGFTVFITDRGRPHCAGSVIGPTKVVTAGHCAQVAPSRLAVIASRPDLRNQSVGQVIGVNAAIAHPDFHTDAHHDVAVLSLVAPTTAPAVRLASVAEDATAATLPGSPLRVAGWGATRSLGFRFSRILLTTIEKVRGPRRCARPYRKGFFAPSMICALGRNIPKTPFHSSACVGDSGAPLVADLPGGPRLVGITSFGGGIGFIPLCGFRRLPSVYSRVSDALGFLQPYVGT